MRISPVDTVHDPQRADWLDTQRIDPTVARPSSTVRLRVSARDRRSASLRRLDVDFRESFASISSTAARSCAGVNRSGIRISATPPTTRACTVRDLRAERITRYSIPPGVSFTLPAMATDCRMRGRGGR